MNTIAACHKVLLQSCGAFVFVGNGKKHCGAMGKRFACSMIVHMFGSFSEKHDIEMTLLTYVLIGFCRLHGSSDDDFIKNDTFA